MMLKGLAAPGCVASARAPSTRPVPLRRHAAFQGARPSVRVFAAEGEQQQQKRERAPRQPKVYTVKVEDLKEGDELEGKVVSVEDYGAFVDFGARVQGLIHVSKLSAGFVKNVKDVVKVGEAVSVRILQVDVEKGRVSLELKGAEAAEGAAPAAGAEDGEEAAADGYDEEWGVDLEEGQVEVRADVRGFEDLAIIVDEEDVAEMSEAAVAQLEADPEAVEVVYELDAPYYLAEVSGKVTRVEDYGAFVEFEWEGKTMSGLLAAEEAKVPFASLSAEQQAALKAKWAPTGFQPPAWVSVEDEHELDVKATFKVGDKVDAYILDPDTEGRGIALTQFTDEEVAADAVAAYENTAEEDEELLDILMEAEEDDDAEESMASGPLDLLAEDDEQVAAVAGSEEEETGFTAAGAGGMLRNKAGRMIAPMGLPSRSVNLNRSALASLASTRVDFDGDEIELEDYWTMDYTIPKKAMAKVGLKMSIDENGEPVFTEREDFNGVLPVFHLRGSLSERAAAFVEDILGDDADEALPIRAYRKPIVLAAAVSSISAATVKELRNMTGAGMMDCKKALTECEGDMEKASEWLRKKGLAGADKKAGRIAAEGGIARYIHPGGRLGVLLEVNCETDFVAASENFNKLVNELGMIIASTDCVVVSPEDVSAEMLAREREIEMGKEDLANKPEAMRAKIVEGRLEKIKNQMALLNQPTLSDPNKTVSELVKETIAAVGENVKIRRFIKYRLGEGIEKKSNDFAAEVAQQTQAKAPAPKKEEPKKEEPKKEAAPAIAISASLVKELRNLSGAGMMDCKKALAECNLDMEAAQDWLRQKGLAGADKKAGRIAAEGVVAAYIHPGSRLGVLLEVNCETDFVAASEKFNQLVGYIAMGIAAAQGVKYVAAEDIPAEVFEHEKQMEMAREDLKSKPEAIRAKIAEGRARKIAEEMALLNQPYLLDDKKTVAEAIKEAIATIGEKISIRRFEKFNLGEGLEKKSNDFAAEVAAATGKK